MSEPATYIIEIRQKPMSDKIVAHCYVLGLKATSVSGHMCAVGACARKVAKGGHYSLRQYNRYTWLCDVHPLEAAP